MKALELIKQLQEMIDKYGDCEVEIAAGGFGCDCHFDIDLTKTNKILMWC